MELPFDSSIFIELFTIVQMMHVSDHTTQKTFIDYIKLSSDEIAD